jgi:hypothetical protein
MFDYSWRLYSSEPIGREAVAPRSRSRSRLLATRCARPSLYSQECSSGPLNALPLPRARRCSRGLSQPRLPLARLSLVNTPPSKTCTTAPQRRSCRNEMPPKLPVSYSLPTTTRWSIRRTSGGPADVEGEPLSSQSADTAGHGGPGRGPIWSARGPTDPID